ncbi:hypothetical protein BCR43DRAFT_495601 [Syncephalastrum racemosum]|uniref:Atos-like conserved domain-containing protein n=1 Tax=Syncephalastrum racemosum TaxID=13706 RepID=A0A1X2H6D2_SYNRA|nr:hypothetical protein BCR43DRAFT_495601 [Syncephalastrum racemosum]
MGILIKDLDSPPSDLNTSNVVFKLINTILRARMGSQYECAQDHAIQDPCWSGTGHRPMALPERDRVSIVISVLKKAPYRLLERWEIGLDASLLASDTGAHDTSTILLLQAVYSYTRLMPIHSQIKQKVLDRSDLGFVVRLCGNKMIHICCSHGHSNDDNLQEACEFAAGAHLKRHQFQRIDSEVSMDVHVTYEDDDNKTVTEGMQRLNVRPSSLLSSRLSDTNHTNTNTNTNANTNTNTSTSTNTNMNTNTLLHPHRQRADHPPLLQSQHRTRSSPANALPTTAIATRRLSRLSLSAMEDTSDNEDTDEKEEVCAMAVPIPSPRMQYTHHHGHHRTIAYSTSPMSLSSTPRPNIPHYHHPHASHQPHQYQYHPHHPLSHRLAVGVDSVDGLSSNAHQHINSLVGSYEESLLSGRMSTKPSKPIHFQAQIGVLGKGDCKPSLKCPAHWSVEFPAFFYDLQDDELSTPYVGTIDFDGKGGYRLPPQGQLQIVIKNPNKTAVKLFLIPYDMREMPCTTKTLLRQKSYADYGDTHQALRYAIQIHICRTEKGRIYLYKQMRVVFTNRAPGATRERLNVVGGDAGIPVYAPLTGADREWLRKKKH